MGYRLFEEGPQGRAIYVDENNRLILNADPTASGYIYQYGPKGYPLLVDASGRLLVSVSGVGTGDVSTAQLIETSGHLQDQIDTLKGLDWQESVLSKTYLAPPGGSVLGDRYIVATGASGAWVGQDDNIVQHNGNPTVSGVIPSGSWDVTVANEGMASWVEDENKLYIYNGASWIVFGAFVTHNNLAGIQGGQTGEYYHLTVSQRNAVSGIGYGTVIPSGGGWAWDAGESLYYADITHSLDNQYVLVQCHDPVTYDSIDPDHFTLTDEDHTRIWSSIDHAMGVTIRLSSSRGGAPTPSIYDLGTIGSGVTPVDWSKGYTQKMFLNGNPTLTFTNGVVGGVYMLALTQDASGSRIITWPGSTRWASDIPLSLTTTANRVDYFGFIYDGTYYNGCAVVKNLYV